MTGYEKRGYLNSDFRLFHLTDTKKQDFEYHYHDFDKIIIFIRGRVTYRIEGQAYELQPYDIVLVSHNDIHRPDIDPSVPTNGSSSTSPPASSPPTGPTPTT